MEEEEGASKTEEPTVAPSKKKTKGEGKSNKNKEERERDRSDIVGKEVKKNRWSDKTKGNSASIEN